MTKFNGMLRVLTLALCAWCLALAVPANADWWWDENEYYGEASDREAWDSDEYAEDDFGAYDEDFEWNVAHDQGDFDDWWDDRIDQDWNDYDYYDDDEWFDWI